MGIKTRIHRFCPACGDQLVFDSPYAHLWHVATCQCPKPPGPIDPPTIPKRLVHVIEAQQEQKPLTAEQADIASCAFSLESNAEYGGEIVLRALEAIADGHHTVIETAELEKLRTDARRYRWLRKNIIDGDLVIAKATFWELESWSGDRPDETIDAAQREESND